MVARYAAMFWLFLGCLLVAAAQGGVPAQLWVEMSDTSVQWGRSLRVQIHYLGSEAGRSLDLAAWERDFHAELEDTYREVPDSTEHGQVHEVVRLKLYPRGIGNVSLPALSWGDAHSAPIFVDVVAPTMRTGTIQLQYSVQLAEWQGAQQRGQIVVHAPDRDAQVQFAEAHAEDADLWRTQASLVGEDDAGRSHHLSWTTRLLDVDRPYLELPPVLYSLYGKLWFRFYFPRMSVPLRALPEYIPATTVVAELRLEDRSTEDLSVEDEEIWLLDFASEGMFAAGLPELERQLLAWTGSMDALERSQGERWQDGRLISTLRYRIRLPDWILPWQSARFGVRYFSLQTGGVRQLQIAPPIVWRMPLLAWIAMMLVWGGLFAWALFWFWPYLRCYRDRGRILHEIAAAVDARGLRRVVLKSHVAVALQQNGQQAARDLKAMLDAAVFSASGQPGLADSKRQASAFVRKFGWLGRGAGIDGSVRILIKTRS